MIIALLEPLNDLALERETPTRAGTSQSRLRTSGWRRSMWFQSRPRCDPSDERGLELTEELAAELGKVLCIPVIDASERDPDATPTHFAGGYRARRAVVASSLSLKQAHASLL